MLKNSELECLLDAMRSSLVTSLEVKYKDQLLRLSLPVSDASTVPEASSTPQVMVADMREVVAVSPSIGTFLRRGIDDGLALLERGMQVSTGDVLGYVCQGPVRVIVDAPESGVLGNDGPDDGTVMGLGDTVFNIEVKV
ncbi:MAG: hypothetical protein AB8B63_10780 [Granulosicoccus sp.]